MSSQEVFVQQFAMRFNHYHETTLPEPEQGSAAWSAIPAEQRSRLVAAARLAILDLESDTHLQDDSRRYFAIPGEAEWGC